MEKKYFGDKEKEALKQASKAKNLEQFQEHMTKAYYFLDEKLVQKVSEMRWYEKNDPVRYNKMCKEMEESVEKANFMKKEKERIEEQQLQKKKQEEEDEEFIKEIEKSITIH